MWILDAWQTDANGTSWKTAPNFMGLRFMASDSKPCLAEIPGGGFGRRSQRLRPQVGESNGRYRVPRHLDAGVATLCPPALRGGDLEDVAGGWATELESDQSLKGLCSDIYRHFRTGRSSTNCWSRTEETNRWPNSKRGPLGHRLADSDTIFIHIPTQQNEG